MSTYRRFISTDTTNNLICAADTYLKRRAKVTSYYVDIWMTNKNANNGLKDGSDGSCGWSSWNENELVVELRWLFKKDGVD